MLADNTILLGIIALLNGAYLFGQKNQRADFKEMTGKFEALANEFLIVKTEHHFNHPDQLLPRVKPPEKKVILKRKGLRRSMALVIIILLISI